MKKFRNIKTGAILAPNSEFVEEQMTKSDLYEEIGAKSKEPTISELKKILDEKGIEYSKDAKKEELLALINQE